MPIAKKYFYQGEYRTIKEIAELERISTSTVRREIIANNDKPPVKITKFIKLKISYKGEIISLYKLCLIKNADYEIARRRYKEGIRDIDKLLVSIERKYYKEKNLRKDQLQTLAEFDKITANDKY